MRKKWRLMRLAGLPFLVLATGLTAVTLPSRAAAGNDVGTVVLGIEPLDDAPALGRIASRVDREDKRGRPIKQRQPTIRIGHDPRD